MEQLVNISKIQINYILTLINIILDMIDENGGIECDIKKLNLLYFKEKIKKNLFECKLI